MKTFRASPLVITLGVAANATPSRTAAQRVDEYLRALSRFFLSFNSERGKKSTVFDSAPSTEDVFLSVFYPQKARVTIRHPQRRPHDLHVI